MKKNLYKFFNFFEKKKLKVIKFRDVIFKK